MRSYSTVLSEQGFTELAAVDPERWNALLRGGMAPLRHEFLLPCAATLPDLAWRAFAGSLGDGGVEVVCPAFEHRWQGGVVSRLLPRVTLLEVGNPCCTSAPFAGRGPGAAALWLDRLIEGFRTESGAQALVVRDDDGALGPLLSERGFSLVSRRATYVLQTGFDDLEAYLQAMRASYRRRARTYLRLELTVEREPAFAALIPDMARLFAITAGRSDDSRQETIGADCLSAWAELPMTQAVSVVDPASGATALALVLVDPPVLHFHRCGFLHADRRSGVYVRLLYELVAMAIEHGCSHLDLGTTCADPKLRLGAVPVPLGVWLLPRSGLVRRALGPLLALRTEPALPVRRVFREPQPPLRARWYSPTP